MRRSGALLLAAVMTLTLAACTQAPPPPEPVPTPTPTPAPTATPAPARPLEFVLPCYPEASFHPIVGNKRTNLALSGLMYEGLYELDRSFAPQPKLAEASRVTADGLLWSIDLRDDVTFSDGTPLTADDVVHSLELARQSELYAKRFWQVTGVSQHEGVVEITLKSPNGALPALLDVPIVRETEDPHRPLGTGPYVLMGEEALCLSLRGSYWGHKRPPLSRIPLREVEKSEDLVYAFDTREISLVGTDLTGASSLGFSGSFETVDYPTTSMLFLGFTTEHGPCQDGRVRSALSRAIDRESICTTLLSRHAVPATLPFHPASIYYDESAAEGLSYSPHAMEELLAQAGWERTEGRFSYQGQPLSLDLIVCQDNPYKEAIADDLADTLRSFGMDITVEHLSWSEYMTRLEAGDFDLYLGEVRLTADFDPTLLVTPRDREEEEKEKKKKKKKKAEEEEEVRQDINYGYYAAGDPLILANLCAAQGEARVEAARVFSGEFVERSPFAVIGFKNWSALIQWGQTTGITPTQQNLFYDFSNWQIVKD